MGPFARFVMAGAALALTAPAIAQFSDSFSFLQGVKDRDGDKVMPILNKSGLQVINTRDPNTGETALHILVKSHDMTWLTFLLSKGAAPNIKDRQGNTPLMIAAQTSDVEAARVLIAVGAVVDTANDSGETPLIRAVLNRDVPMTSVLIQAGANPALKDTVQGKSARDYANEDKRGTAVARLLETAKPKGPSATVAGPMLPR